MTITYHGHSCFKLKGKRGTLVTDPFSPKMLGFAPSGLSADVVTVSHQHQDHNALEQVKGTARRPKPFIVDQPGEYEVGGISVFGEPFWHDASQGSERGSNIIFTIFMDDVRVCHLGDLGHELTEEQAERIGMVDVLLVPVGGIFTINPEQAVKVINTISPSLVIPMHYRTPEHETKAFGELTIVEEFVKEYGAEVTPESKLVVEKERLPEETELVVMEKI